MNSVQLIGRATHDPQPTTTANGTAKTTFRLAVDRIGEGADFVTVKTWDRLAKTISRYLVRGRRVAVQGRLEHEEWTDSDGNPAERQTVVASRVQFLDPPNRTRADGPHSAAESSRPEPDTSRT